MVNKILKTENLFYRNFHGLFAIVNNLVSVMYLDRVNDKNTNWYYEICKNSIYYDESITYTDNVWEYYFKQPSGYKLNEIDNTLPTVSDFFYRFPNSNLTHLYHQKVINSTDLLSMNEFLFKTAKNKIELKEDVQNHIDDVFLKLGLENGKYVSVHYRDYDVGSQEHAGHLANKPSLDVWFSKIDDNIKEDSKIFLSTDSFDIISQFKTKYSEKLICNVDIDRYYMKEYKGYENTSYVEPQNPYTHGLNAITDCWILSKGHTIIRPASGLSFFSLLLNPNINSINID